ncbi:glycosyl transferase, partial [Thioclava sp. BHET1]
ALPLFRSNQNFEVIRKRAARLQRRESEMLEVLRSPFLKARVRVWTLAEFVEAPMEPLQSIIDEMVPGARRRLAEAPRMVDLTGFGQFLQNLKNQGMQPVMTGDFPVHAAHRPVSGLAPKPYLVK